MMCGLRDTGVWLTRSVGRRGVRRGSWPTYVANAKKSFFFVLSSVACFVVAGDIIKCNLDIKNTQ